MVVSLGAEAGRSLGSPAVVVALPLVWRAQEEADVKLEGRVGVVFGAASGIGAACAQALTAEGESVVVADVNEERAGQVIAGIEAAGGTASFVFTDITVEDQVRDAIQTAVDRYGRLDTVVTSAGAPLADWHRAIDMFLKGPYYASLHSVDDLERAGGGTLIHVGSIASIRGSLMAPDVERTGYPSAKHGVLGLSRTLALAYGPKNIRVNVDCPGYIKTELTRSLYEAPDGDAFVTERLNVPLGRWGEPEDIGKVVAFLASDDASFISGQAIVVDGGLTAR
jgi:NAD(P)-dependent dehydrogenase (short-subunit alcohol dehydrogenase family)